MLYPGTGEFCGSYCERWSPPCPPAKRVRRNASTTSVYQSGVKRTVRALYADSMHTGYNHRVGNSKTPAATSNSKGCWIHMGTGKNGHVAVRPSIQPSGKRVANGSPRTPRRCGQFVHRLAVKAWHTPETIERLAVKSSINWEVSHLCWQPACFNPGHLCVESHDQNERRKQCVNKSVCTCKGSPACIVR